MKDVKINAIYIELITDANALAIYVWVMGMDGDTYNEKEVLAHFEWMTHEEHDIAINHLKHLGYLKTKETTTYEFFGSVGVQRNANQ